MSTMETLQAKGNDAQDLLPQRSYRQPSLVLSYSLALLVLLGVMIS